jgi:Flp pilus assembly protein TadD
LLLMGRWEEAMVQFQQALQIKPDDAGVHVNLGKTLLLMGREDEAIVHYRRALQMDPRSVKFQNHLAWVLATVSSPTLRDGRQAVELAEQANQLAGGKDPVILRTLAAACAEAGRFDDAVRNAQKARELAQAAGQSDLVRQLDGQLKFYTARLPFHQETKRFED